MIYISHRVNTIEQLKTTPENFGVEIDLRESGNRIILQHDPFTPGEDFENYLKHYKHEMMILNIKSERIEHKAKELVEKYKIKDYFFLDSSFPMIFLLSNQGEKNVALRLSEYEGMDTLINMAGKVKWVWIDCFTKIPVEKKDIEKIKALGYKTCFVSPELQGRPDDVEKYIKHIQDKGIYFDAVCSKQHMMEKWMNL